MSSYAVPPRQPDVRRRTSLPSRLAPPALMLAAMWVVYIVQVVVGPAAWQRFGITAGDYDRAWTIVTAPFLHGGALHIINNTIAFVWLAFFVALEGRRRFGWLTAISALVSGVGVLLLAPAGSVTVGMSGVIFGYFGYLLVATFVERNVRARVGRIASMLVIFLWWGTSFFAGFFPRGNMSWQAHLFGALGGAIVAIVAERREFTARQTARARY